MPVSSPDVAAAENRTLLTSRLPLLVAAVAMRLRQLLCSHRRGSLQCSRFRRRLCPAGLLARPGERRLCTSRGRSHAEQPPMSASRRFTVLAEFRSVLVERRTTRRMYRGAATGSTGRCRLCRTRVGLCNADARVRSAVHTSRKLPVRLHRWKCRLYLGKCRLHVWKRLWGTGLWRPWLRCSWFPADVTLAARARTCSAATGHRAAASAADLSVTAGSFLAWFAALA